MSVSGFRFAAAAAGIKKSGALDLGLLVADDAYPTAAVFTRNLVRAAPVEVAERRVAAGLGRAILVNSGNANACTGRPGLEATQETTTAVATALGVDPDLVLPASTGVIGQVLPSEKIITALPRLLEALGPDERGFAEAILTTDRWAKVSRTEVGAAHVLGICKGAGMIHPDLGPAPPHATMLGFLVTDAKVDQPGLQKALERAVELTFNACSVDGDTSTNDTVILMASGRSGVALDETELLEALIDVCRPLAREMVRDGEGAEHAVDITVRGLKTEADARAVAETVATSPLVKTAFFGKDPNWGRLLAAAGRAGIPFDPQVAEISIGGFTVCRAGLPVGGQSEVQAAQVMKGSDYTVVLSLGDGPAEFTYVTSDLGHGYIDVNAGYRS